MAVKSASPKSNAVMPGTQKSVNDRFFGISSCLSSPASVNVSVTGSFRKIREKKSKTLHFVSKR